MTLGVSAVFISLMSLFLGIQHGRVMEKMVEANTWAFVTVGVSTAEYDHTPHVRDDHHGGAEADSQGVLLLGARRMFIPRYDEGMAAGICESLFSA
jgi:hypothetical protein